MNDQITDDLQDVFRLVVESNRRCIELRVKLIRGEVAESDVSKEYAVATAPLAKAAQIIDTGKIDQ